MIRKIVTDPIFLSRKSEPASKEDIQTINDLLDTLKANSNCCVGMAANMIGVSKTILAAIIDNEYIVMINPQITGKSKQSFEAEESCLSLNGVRNAVRYKSITVEYLDRKFKKKKQTFIGFNAQIIQHEIDHFNGVLI